MKYLLHVLFILALFCGVSSYAHADADFHVQVLDPANMCFTNPSLCVVVDSSAPFAVTFNSATCGLDGLPTGPTDGCLIVVNDTFDTFTSLDLTFSGLGSLTFDCPTSNPASVFANSSCTSSGGIDNLFFSGGAGLPGGQLMFIYESGADPALFDGTGTVGITPEPESLFLFSTGVMMMMAGLFLRKQRPAFAFGKK